MPLYEYQCDACGQRFEVIQKFSDPPVETCACGGPVKKLLSSPAIQFKGSGWYVTDYARKSGDAASSSTDTKPASGDAKPSTSTTASDTAGPSSSSPSKSS
jgi:putative FmdB family regulatory protein